MNSDYSGITAKLASIIENDKTIAVTKIAIECIPLFAKLLKKDFNMNAKTLVPVLLNRLKEKKIICDIVLVALEALDTYSLSFVDNMEGKNFQLIKLKFFRYRYIFNK